MLAGGMTTAANMNLASHSFVSTTLGSSFAIYVVSSSSFPPLVYFRLTATNTMMT